MSGKHVRGKHEAPEYVHPYYSANPGKHLTGVAARRLTDAEKRIAWAQINLRRGVGRLLRGGAA
jgi:hypothetical protein